MNNAVSPHILLNDIDDVAVARLAIPAGQPTVTPISTPGELIARGHKVAIRAIPSGHEVRKYGQIIGPCDAGYRSGSHVHLHNLAMLPSEHEHQFCVDDIEEKGMLPNRAAPHLHGL